MGFSRKSLRKLAFTVLPLLLLVFLSGSLAVAQEKVYKIGAVFPLSGNAAQYGENKRFGSELAKDEINAAGGIKGVKLEVLYGDSKGLPREGVAAVNKLIQIDKVPAFLATMSGVVMSAIPIAESNKAVLLNTAALNPGIREGGDYIFSNMTLGDFEGNARSEFCFKELGYRKMVIFNVNNEFGNSVRDVVIKDWKKFGGTITATETYEQGARDFRTQLAKAAQSKPEVIDLIGYYAEMGLIVKQAREMGIKSQFVSYAGITSQKFIEITGEAGEGVIATQVGWDPTDPAPQVQEFIKHYRKKYNRDPELYGATAFDGIKLIGLAIQNGGYSADGIKKALYKVKDYPGVTGRTTFDQDGIAVKPVNFTILKNGKFVPFKKELMLKAK